MQKLFSDLSKLNNAKIPSLKNDGYQTCPFCKREKKLRTSSGKYYKCFHPDCNASGDVYSLVAHFSGCSKKEAYKSLHIELDTNTKFWQRRSDLLERVFSIYQTEVTDDILEFLNSRGYYTALEEVQFGYAPNDKFLQKNGLKLEDLIEVGLAYKSGSEFFHNRVIFGIRDLKSRLVHLQGRSVDPENDLRWLSTPSRLPDQTVSPISNYLFDAHIYRNKPVIKYLFLAEGVSDCLSLIELDAPGVGCFGVQIDLLKFIDLFSKVENLIVVLDNDRYSSLRSSADEYKSWTPMMYSLCELQNALPDLNIICAPPPSQSGIKDVNDWLKQGLTPGALSYYVQSKGQDLVSFAINSMGVNWQHQELLIRLINIHKKPNHLDLFKSSMNSLEPDPVQYVLKTFGK